jgi:hypothetical protein
MPAVDTSVNLLLWKAIDERRMIRFVYRDKLRVVEPHDYGVQNGRNRLFGFQVEGESSQSLPNWRLMNEEDISSIELLERRFPGGRPTPSGKHLKWDKLFIRVKPAGRRRTTQL